MRLQGPITAAAWLNQESKANWTNANTGSTQLTIFVLQPKDRRTRYVTNNNKMPHRTNPIFPTCVPKKKAWYSSDPSDPTSGPKDQNNPPNQVACPRKAISSKTTIHFPAKNSNRSTSPPASLREALRAGRSEPF